MKKRKKSKQNRGRGKSVRTDIPEQAKRSLTEIIEMTDAFCQKYLNEEYREFCEDMAAMLYAVDVPIKRARPASWASGIVHALGWVNFLQDPNFAPYMSSKEVAKGLGVSQETMLAKSRIIRDELDLIQLDPEWCLPSRLKDNPLVWTIDVGGFLMDVRYAPPEIQQEAYQLGLIPYIPADQQEAEPESDTEPKVIKFPPGQNDTSRSKLAQKPKDDGPNLFEGLED